MYENLRKKTGKYFIKKYQYPFGPIWPEDSGMYKSQVTGQLMGSPVFNIAGQEQLGSNFNSEDTEPDNIEDPVDKRADRLARRSERRQAREDRAAQFAADKGLQGTSEGTLGSAIGNLKSGNAGNAIMDVASVGMKVIDNIALSDKNFGAQSEAIDSAVNSASSALKNSGNPYAQIAGFALEGANFLTKAGGQTVQGFDVDINSSGYGQMGHMESSSSRDFGAMIGLGGIFGQGRMRAKLAKRNQQAQMAMNAANIANEQKFEQEARANSIQNVIMNNQVALAGGLDTSLLGG